MSVVQKTRSLTGFLDTCSSISVLSLNHAVPGVFMTAHTANDSGSGGNQPEAAALLRTEINSSTFLTHLVLTVGEFYSRDRLR